MKRFRKALGIVALALVASLALAMPVSAWADETESYGKPDVSGPQSAWYDGQSHHFRSTVKDSVSGKDRLHPILRLSKRPWQRGRYRYLA